MLRKNVISVMTQAKADGLLSYDGTAYALTEKGKKAILNPTFVSNRLAAEEAYLQSAADVLKAEAEKLNGEELLSDACSKYRGGFVSKESAELEPLIENLKGVELPRASGEFHFTGGRGDLSYFWQKNGDNSFVNMPKSMIDGIKDESLRANVVSTMTQARLEGLVTDEGDFYSLTEAGNKAIHNPKFVADRLHKEALNEAKGLDGLNKGDKLFVFTKGTEAHEFSVIGGVVDGEGLTYIKLLSNEQGELMLPKEAIGNIAFEDKEAGEAYVKANPEKAAEYQELIETQKKELITTEEYTRSIEETEDAYLINVGENSYEKLEIPKADAEMLEDGSVKATIYGDKKYNLHSGDVKSELDGHGAKELLDKGGKTVKATSEAAAKVGAKAADAAVNTVDGIATSYPPAKVVSAVIKVIYSSVKTAVSAAQKTSSMSQKL